MCSSGQGKQIYFALIFMSKCSLLYCNYNPSFSSLTIIISIWASLVTTCGSTHQWHYCMILLIEQASPTHMKQVVHW